MKNKAYSVDDLLKTFSDKTFEKGFQFEVLVKWWLKNDPFWKNHLIQSTIKLWNESPHRQGRDIGIDLTAEDHFGNIWAIQAKNWKEQISLPKSEIDKFLSASNTRKFNKRLLVTTTSTISANALTAMEQQEKEAKRVTINELRESNVDWQLFLDNPKALATKSCKIPFPHQKLAIENTVAGLLKNKRGQLIMACGSGKTITAQRIDEKLNSKLSLVLVPSLLLVQQTLKSWREESQKDFLSMAICSDDTVGNDSAIGRARDLSIPVTTDSREIKEFLKSKGRKVIFSTYQSSAKIAKAIKGTNYKFDLVIADEAHRLAGNVDKEYGTVLQKNLLPSQHYLFMTATPRIFTTNIRNAASARGVEIFSMDDETVFGKPLHTYSFNEAIKDKVLTDYRVVVVGVDNPMIEDMIKQRELVKAGETNMDARTLASHIGLAKAMHEYDLNRVISFHSKIKTAAHFASSHSKIRDWMNDPHLNTTKLRTFTLSGQDSSQERKRVLNQLSLIDKNTHGLLTNARCLTEGVDVPTLDGIAFIDPRSSQVDIVQAVGRAIRKGGADKKYGYIIIPVFLSKSDMENENISDVSFQPIWNVINALQSHDSHLAEEINNLRINLSKTGKIAELSSKLIIDLPLKVSNKFAEHLKIKILIKSSEDWYENFGHIISFYEKNRHLNIPTTDDHYKSLVIWIRQQRQRYKKKQLSKKKIALLEGINGWTWDPFDLAWSTGYQNLLNYVSENGHARPPAQFVNEDGYAIGRWVSKQRKRKAFLSSEKLDALEKLEQWSWDPNLDDWNLAYEAILEFVRIHGTSKTPSRYKYGPNNYSLGQWVKAQRYNRDNLDKNQIRKLESLPDWSWNPLEDSWERGFNELQKYYSEFNDANVPSKYVTADNFKLGLWVGHIRTKKRILSSRKKRSLEALKGWNWHSKDYVWMQNFNSLSEYVKKYGNMPSKDFTDEKVGRLGRWVHHQRNFYKKNQLSPKRIELLESISGWEWYKQESDWDNAFNILQEFLLTYNRYPKDKEKHMNKSIGAWVYKQKKDRDKLSSNQVIKLESLDNWLWRGEKESIDFQNGILSLMEFHKENGHINIPNDYKGSNSFNLRSWVHSQRNRKKRGTLTTEQVKALEDIPGWRWWGD